MALSSNVQVCPVDTEEDLVLSDVHLNKTCSEGNAKLQKSRFPFHNPHRASCDRCVAEHCGNQDDGDGDGDFDDIERSPNSANEVLVLEHCMATPLAQVGLQVWRGSLYLADFVLHHHHTLFKDKVVLELGGGIGLCSIVTAMFSKCVVCTDLDHQGILDLCLKNASSNQDVLKGELVVAELNWETFTPEDFRKFPSGQSLSSILHTVDIVIAADVVYSDDLTGSLLACIKRLMQLSQRTLQVWIGLERRINFTLDAMQPASPAYACFVRSVTEGAESTGLQGNREDIEKLIPQYFQYERTAQLEIWRLSSYK